MRPEDLKAILDRKPFRPVRLVMVDGQSVDVRHPEMAIVSRPHVMVPVEVSPEGIVDRQRWLNLLLVLAVEDLGERPNGAVPTPPAPNGQPRA